MLEHYIMLKHDEEDLKSTYYGHDKVNIMLERDEEDLKSTYYGHHKVNLLRLHIFFADIFYGQHDLK